AWDQPPVRVRWAPFRGLYVDDVRAGAEAKPVARAGRASPDWLQRSRQTPSVRAQPTVAVIVATARELGPSAPHRADSGARTRSSRTRPFAARCPNSRFGRPVQLNVLWLWTHRVAQLRQPIAKAH